jgi:recombination protein RecA
MTPPAKATTKAAPKKKATTKKKTPDIKAIRSKKADVIRKYVLKHTGQKPREATFSTNPHVPSGCFSIDDLIGGSPAADGKGRKCPGYPRKRITEIYGPEASGKTTAALHAIIEVQKAGGLAVFLDYEHALDADYARKLGVSFAEDQLLFYSPDTLEQGMQTIYVALQGGVDLIVVDSVAAMVPKEEMEAKLDKEGRMGALARVLGRNLPKLIGWLNNEKFLKNNPEGCAVLLLNQTRADVGSKIKGSVKTPGGFAMKFYCTIRLQFMPQKQEFLKQRNKFTGKEVSYPYGSHTRVKMVKNKLDLKNGHTHDIFIRYGHGIDDYYSLIAAGLYYKVIRKEGSWFHCEEQRYQGREALRKFLKEHADVCEKVRLEVLARCQGSGVIEEEDLSEEDLFAQDLDRSMEDMHEHEEEDEGEFEEIEEVEVSEEDSDMGSVGADDD